MATVNNTAQTSSLLAKLSSQNETTWIKIGNLAEGMKDFDRATKAYEAALRHNPYSFTGLFQIASLYRSDEQYQKATEYFQRALHIDNNNGEAWGSLGHCYLMMDELQKAYSAYQQALYHLPNPKDPKLWYGIGILYDRYGSLEHAEEAFSAVMRMEANFDKGNEIYFRLGIIYKQQGKLELSLQCFRYIIQDPPRPLKEADIWFQIGHVHEQQKEYVLAKESYERVIKEIPTHAKVLQQLGWLHHQTQAPYCNQDKAIAFLRGSIESDGNDAQTWYLLGRCYMIQQKYNKAYDSYQQAVYRDGRNPTFWCSIGVLYYQINQYRDALDAYSRAIRLNPHISEVWYDLGTLYESCNNQIEDARDAYNRALDLDPGSELIKQRLAYLNSSQTGGSAPPAQDINTSLFPNNGFTGANGQPSQFNQGPIGPPPGLQSYPNPSETRGSLSTSIHFPPAGERPNGNPDVLPPMGRNLPPGPGNHRPNPTLPTINREDHPRNNEHLPPVRPDINDGHMMRDNPPPTQMQDGYRGNHLPHGYHRQPMKHPEPNNNLGVDSRKMSFQSPNMAARTQTISSHPHAHPGVDQRHYIQEQPSSHHPNDRRDYDNHYKQRNPSYSRSEHHSKPHAPYPNPSERPGYNHDHNYPSDPRRSQSVRAPQHGISSIIDRPHQPEERNHQHQLDVRNPPQEEKARPLPARLTKTEAAPSPKLSEAKSNGPRFVDEDYDMPSETLANGTESTSTAPTKPTAQTAQAPQVSTAQAKSESTRNEHYHLSQPNESPVNSPKNDKSDSKPELPPSRSPVPSLT